jgi:hypothetical protein
MVGRSSCPKTDDERQVLPAHGVIIDYNLSTRVEAVQATRDHTGVTVFIPY